LSDLAVRSAVPATAPETLEKIANYEQEVRKMPQIHIQTEHLFHAGMYARTIRLAARVAITSVLIKIPTTIIVNGRCRVFTGEWLDLSGYNVIPANGGRKLLYITAEPTQITMLFPSNAKTVEEAERQFTEEFEMLLSRSCNDDVVTVTGVEPCPA